MTNQILKLSTMAMKTLKDPVLLMFGEKFLKKGWRQFDRDFLKQKNEVNAILDNCIRKYQQNEFRTAQKEKSIVELILSQRDAAKENFISDEELRDEIKTFVVAGSETTSNFLVGLVFYVFEKPAVVSRLRE